MPHVLQKRSYLDLHACHSIINCYLSFEKGSKLFDVGLHVPRGWWHLTGPSIKVSSAFHTPSSRPAKSPSWWSDSSHSNNYPVCVTIVSAQQPSEEDSSIFFLSLSLFHTQTKSVSHVCRVGERPGRQPSDHFWQRAYIRCIKLAPLRSTTLKSTLYLYNGSQE